MQGRYDHEDEEADGAVHQMFLADVLLGYVKDYGTELAEQLTRPPERLPNVLFDSVQVLCLSIRVSPYHRCLYR